MTEDQRALILELTKDDAIRLIEAKDIGTWKRICRSIQDLARSGACLPRIWGQFDFAGRDEGNSKQYVATEVQPR